MTPTFALALLCIGGFCCLAVSEAFCPADIPVKRQYHIAIPLLEENIVAVQSFIAVRSATYSPVRYEQGVLYDDDYLRIPIDPHIRGPLIGEIEAEFKKYNPSLRVRVYNLFDDCNFCRMPGTTVCTLMGCDYRWWTFLYLGRHTQDSVPFPTLIIPPLVFEWNECEMRERWRPTIEPEAFPFPTNGPGDVPPLVAEDNI